MSIARKCDICGKLYEDYEGVLYNNIKVNGIELTMRYLSGSFFRRDNMDVCPDCMGSILVHIESLRNKE